MHKETPPDGGRNTRHRGKCALKRNGHRWQFRKNLHRKPRNPKRGILEDAKVRRHSWRGQTFGAKRGRQVLCLVTRCQPDQHHIARLAAGRQAGRSRKNTVTSRPKTVPSPPTMRAVLKKGWASKQRQKQNNAGARQALGEDPQQRCGGQEDHVAKAEAKP